MSVLDFRTLEHAYERGLIDADDYADATEFYINSQPEFPWDDPVWFVGPQDFETWEEGPPIPPGTVLEPPGLPGLPGRAPHRNGKPDWRNWEKYLDCGGLPPIRGGSPEAKELSFSAGDLLNALVPRSSGPGLSWPRSGKKVSWLFPGPSN